MAHPHPQAVERLGERPGGRFDRRPDWHVPTQAERADERTRNLEVGAKILYARPGADLSRFVPAFADTPHLGFKLPQDRRFDEVLKREMALRRSELELPLNTAKVTVVAADLATDPVAAAQARSAVRHYLPGRHRSQRSGLRDLARASGRPSAAAVRAALTEYKGETLVLVGHTTSDHSEMQWTVSGRQVVIDLALWNAVAAETGVNLLVLGCRSSRFVDIGSPFLLNSGPLLSSLGRALSSERTTFRRFYRELTSEDLQLAVNPFVANLGYRELSWVDRSGNEVGRIHWRPDPDAGPPRLVQAPTNQTIASVRDKACWASSTTVDALIACDEASKAQESRKAAEAERVRAVQAFQAALDNRQRAFYQASLGTPALTLLAALIAAIAPADRDRRSGHGFDRARFGGMFIIWSVPCELLVLACYGALLIANLDAALPITGLSLLLAAGLLAGSVGAARKREIGAAVLALLAAMELGLIALMALSQFTVSSAGDDVRISTSVVSSGMN